MTTIQIEAKPHRSQGIVHRDPTRFKVLAAGRRWGKTRLGVNECMDVASGGGRAWWVAPTYKLSEVGWRPLRKMGAKLGVEVRKVDRQVVFPSGGWVQIRSADDPDSLRGEGLDFVVMDECAFMYEAAWTEAISPSLSDRKGRALFISTPKRRNWFWKVWTIGQSGDDPEWKSWRFPTEDNPYIDPAEIDAAKRRMPERTFRQEYLAEFIDNEGAVFRNIAACLYAVGDVPADHAGHETVMGVDWGKSEDYTVCSVGCRDCRREVALDRFHGIDYRLQRQRIQALAERWGVYDILAESNSMGEPNIEDMQYSGLPVRGFQTTASSKPPLIENLVLTFEREEMQFIDNPVATAELEAYEMKASANTGRPTYSAPEGLHDDTVIARALMANAMQLRGAWMTLLG